jgi:hypothetical protein
VLVDADWCRRVRNAITRAQSIRGLVGFIVGRRALGRRFGSR